MNFFTVKPLLYAIGALLVITLALGFQLKQEIKATGALKQNVVQLNQSLKEQAEELKAAQEERQKVDTILVDRERERSLLYTEVGQVKKQLRVVKETSNEAYKDCLDTPIPDAVSQRLRDLSGKTRDR